MTLLKRVFDPRLWIGLCGAAAAVYFVVHTESRAIGPGPLSAVHAAVPELDGGRNCAACHGEGGAGTTNRMAAACNECHEVIGQQLSSGAGFHGSLEDASSCSRCHAEHLGAAYLPVSALAFEAAGIAPRELYDHAGLDFELAGAHASLACVECHANADVDVLALGEQRFLGASQDCTSCHEDVHDGHMGSSCADCHGQERPFSEVASFEHTESFALAGPHAGHACSMCHEPGSPFALASYEEQPRAAVARSCADCHDSPHGAAYVEAAGSACAECHAPNATVGVVAASFREVDVDASRAAHDATGFALIGGHTGLDCEACHDPAAADYAARFPGREASACAACHDDPHGGQFASPTSSSCADCHVVESFHDVSFGRAEHAHLGWPLDGAHGSVACAECHGEGPAADYRGTSRDCASCHDDVHAGAFDERFALAGAAVGTNCSACHDTTSFRGAADGFDHGAATGYELAGAHGDLDCGVCHPPVGARRLGPLQPATSAAGRASCVACHDDPHAGRFDGVGLPESVDGHEGCARCHVESTFREVPPERFDHGRWTGFELVGAHAQSRCITCHGGGAEEATGPRLAAVAASFPAFEPATADSCAPCHEDPHAGRFDPHAPARIEGRVGCARCHGEASFRVPRAFEHDWTGWALDGSHADVACAKCHVGELRTGHVSRAVRGKSCSDCHQDPHLGQFVDGQGSVDCARCHSTDAAFADVRFDHDTSRFPLDDTHAALDCGACHKVSRARDGREAIRYRPLGTTCADCHGTTGRGASGGDR